MDADGHECRQCHRYLPMSQFYGLKTRECTGCKSRRTQARKRLHPEKVRLSNRKAYYRYSYGIDVASLDSMWEAQAGCCALCATKLRRGSHGYALDHCHVTDKVRQLLCYPCNTALGLFRDDPTLLRRAADYIEAHRAN